MILCDISMHLKFGNLKLYTPIHRLTEIKKFPCTQLSVQNGRWAKIGYELGLLVYGTVVIEFGRKLFLVDCLLGKNIKYGENKHNRTRSSVFMHRPFHNSIFIDTCYQ